jgi:uncharacterized protein
MTQRLLASIILAAAGVCVPQAGLARHQSVRVVDSVTVTIARDEASHSLAEEGTSLGETAGRKWRSATGWFSYSLHIYDDSPLTLVLVVADGAGARESFDILVDGRKTATCVREANESKAAEIRFILPLAETAGKTSVTVKLQARAGSSTARLLEVRSVQEHLE